MHARLVIFARHPEPGRVKTRLAAVIGDAAAAELYAAFLRDLADRFRNVADRRVLAYTPNSSASTEWFQKLAGNEYTLWPQPDGSLGDRLRDCFACHLETGDRVIIIGSDAPTLPAGLIAAAAGALDDRDCVLGPAVDGGYYLIGLRDRPPIELFERIDWDGPDVLEQTVRRIAAAGLSLHALPPWYDVDTSADLAALRGHLAALRLSEAGSGMSHTQAALSRVQPSRSELGEVDG